MDTILLMIAFCGLALINLFLVSFGIWLLTQSIKHAADKSSKITGIIFSIILIVAGFASIGFDVHTMLSII